jgi:hypothetical protein
MPRTPTQVDQGALYEAALEGLEAQKQRLEEQIRTVRSLLGGKKTRAAGPASTSQTRQGPAAKKAKAKVKGKSRRKRNLSPEARTRIAEAQRKRWAAFRKDSES